MPKLVAIVTGASQGIGRATAIRLARDFSSITLAARGRENLEETAAAVKAAGAEPLVMDIDLSNSSAAQKVVDQTLAAFGRIDALLNIAGAVPQIDLFEMTDEQWEYVTDVNLRGPWLCSQAFCRRVIAQGRKGNIVNIGSIQAAKVLPGRTHYAPAKLAIEALTRNMSAEMTPLGIRVNCVHPGLIDTDMTAWVMKSADLLPGILAQISLGRAGAPREIGSVAAFFASEESSYLTGQSIHVDGGWVGK